MDWSMNTCSCVSTPSAMMGRFSRLAISMTDSTICLPLLLSLSRTMNCISSLMASTLVLRSIFREE